MTCQVTLSTESRLEKLLHAFRLFLPAIDNCFDILIFICSTMFGQNSSFSFGQTPTTSAPAFGQTPTTFNTGGLFGQTAQQPQQNSLFGAQTTPQQPTLGFGTTSFGQTPAVQPISQSPFSLTSPQSTPAQSTMFGTKLVYYVSGFLIDCSSIRFIWTKFRWFVWATTTSAK